MTAEYGSFDRFRKEFTQAAVSAEGSGWAAVTYCHASERIGIVQVEKHSKNQTFNHLFYVLGLAGLLSRL